MSKRAVLLVVALLSFAVPAQAQEPGGDPEPNGDPEPQNEPQGNQTSNQGSQAGEPPIIYRLLMELLNGDGGRCRVVHTSADPNNIRVDPDGCFLP